MLHLSKHPFWRVALTLVVLCCVWGNLSAADAATNVGGPVVLNTTSSFWRVFYMLQPPVTRDAAGQVQKLSTLTGDTIAPDKSWVQTEFDDSSWTRVVGKPLVPQLGYQPAPELVECGITELDGSSPALSMVCMRGRFGVDNPAAAGDLSLTLRYRGGVVVYLNGTEVGSANLPAGARGPGALADDYPKEAFFKDDGNPVVTISRGKDPAATAIFVARVRTAKIVVSAKQLRKGTNVLAIEVHRAPYHPGVEDWIQKKKLSYQLYGMLWSTCGLTAAELRAAAPGQVQANMERPKGIQLWNSQSLQPDFDVDYGDPFEPLRPIRLVGTRGGCFSGKVVVGSDTPIQGLKATMSDLTGKDGAIPAAQVQVRYAFAFGEEPVLQGHYPIRADLLDGLAEVAPATVDVRKKKGDWIYGAVCPVWITVTVPEKAAPGDYSGSLTIAANGLNPVKVPVTLKVGSYLLPPPSQYTTVLDLMQSPETVALQYNVPLWSDKHFALLEKSLQRAGYVGSWDVHIPLICHTNLGNDESMVRWIKQADGSYKYDFTAVEKYLDLAEKYMGKPRCVDLVVWDLFLGFSGLEENPHFLEHNTNLEKGFQASEVPVTVFDPASGKSSMVMVGHYDAKGKAQWKALVDQLMERLHKRGLDKIIHLGHSYDLCPTDAIVEFWNELLPGVHYFRYGHYDYKTFGKSKSGISDFIVHEWAPIWSIKPLKGWENPVVDLPWMRLQGERNANGGYWKSDPSVSMPMEMFRMWGEICVQSGYRGFGRMGLDFWPVMENERGQKNSLGIQGRYPNSSWRQSDEMILNIVPPGPEGALSSVKLEMLREGQQENEARIVVEKAIEKGMGAKFQPVLDTRLDSLKMALEAQPLAGFDTKLTPYLDGYSHSGLYAMQHGAIWHQWFMESGWQDRASQIFDAAGQAQAAGVK